MTSNRCRPSQTVIYQIMFASFQCKCGNPQMLERRDSRDVGMRSADICFIQETRSREKSVRMIRGKAADYKLFWTGNEKGVEISLVKKWVNKNIDMSRVTAP